MFRNRGRVARPAVAMACVVLAAWVATALTVSGAEPLAEYELGKGWATFGLVLPSGAAREGLRIGALSTQTDIKTTWPDGSIRFAVVSAQIPRSGRYPVTAGPRASGTFEPSLPAAAVDIVIDGSTHSATLPTTLTDLWLDGPNVREGRAVLSFSGATGPAAELRVIFDVRSYVDGGHRVDVTVSNNRNVASAREVAYNVNVRVGGRSVFARGSGTTAGRNPIHASDEYLGVYRSVSHGLAPYDYVRLTSGPKAGWMGRVTDVQDADTFRLGHPLFVALPVTWEKVSFLHPYLARWRHTFATGGLIEASVTPDFAPFQQAGALPRYLDTIRTPARIADESRFDILRLGDLAWPQGMAGDRPDIGLYPAWVAEYVVGRRPDQRDYLLAMGNAAGAISLHVDDADGSMLSLDRRPDFFLDRQDPLGAAGPAGQGAVYSAEVGAAHQPSLAYVPYLITGDRFYLDEMKYWANHGMISWLWERGRADGLVTGQESRGMAWALRSLADVVAYSPDVDPHRAYFTTRLRNNLADLDRRAAAEPDSLGGSMFDGNFKGPQAFFMQSYCLWAFDHVARQGFPAPAYRDRLARYWVRLFDEPGFDRRYVPSYHQFIVDAASGRPFESYRDLFAYNRTPPGEWTAMPPTLVGYYGVNAQLVLMLARDLGIPHAAARYEELMRTEENGVSVAEDVNRRAQYAITNTVPVR